MQLETSRLILREVTWEDFDAWYEILSDPETMQYYPKPFDAEKTGFSGTCVIMPNMALAFGLSF